MSKFNYNDRCEVLNGLYKYIPDKCHYWESEEYTSRNEEVVYKLIELIDNYDGAVDAVDKRLDEVGIPYIKDTSVHPYIYLFMASSDDIVVTPKLRREIVSDIMLSLLYHLERFIYIQYTNSYEDDTITLYSSSTGLAKVLVETTYKSCPNKIEILIDEVNENKSVIRIVSEDEE